MKGLSPLVATILLIAFVIGVAGILSVWLTTFTRTTTELVGEETSKTIICSYGGISLYSLKYSNGFLTGNIENTRSISLGNITLQIIYLNQTSQKNKLCLSGTVAINCTTANVSVSPRELVSFNVSASSNYDKIRVMTNCSSVFDEADKSEVS